MISKWKKTSIVLVLSGAGLLVACNASDESTTVDTKKEAMEKIVTETDVFSEQVENKKVEAPVQLAAVDLPIPEEKKAEEGLPETSGLDDERTAWELAKDTSIKLVNPFTRDEVKIKEGKRKWFAFGCSGCHGGGGGGGMCPPVINEKWVYSGKDDILFRLISVGTDELMKQGHVRVKTEKVVAPMPPVGEMTKMTTEDTWLVLTYMRSKFKGREHKIEW